MILFLSGEHFSDFINYYLKKFSNERERKKKHHQNYGSTKLMYTVRLFPQSEAPVSKKLAEPTGCRHQRGKLIEDNS